MAVVEFDGVEERFGTVTAVEVRCDDGPSTFRALSTVVESGAGLVDFETAAVPLNEAFQWMTEAAAQGGSRMLPVLEQGVAVTRLRSSQHRRRNAAPGRRRGAPGTELYIFNIPQSN